MSSVCVLDYTIIQAHFQRLHMILTNVYSFVCKSSGRSMMLIRSLHSCFADTGTTLVVLLQVEMALNYILEK